LVDSVETHNLVLGKSDFQYQNSSNYNKAHNLPELFSDSENKFLSSYGQKN
jgi:hypothetical protein